MKPTNKFKDSIRTPIDEASNMAKQRQDASLNRNMIVRKIRHVIAFAYKRGEKAFDKKTTKCNL